MCSSGQDDTEDEEKGCEHDSRAAAQSIDGPAKEEHPKDFADEIGVGQAGLDLAGNAVLVQDGEERLHVTNDLSIVAIREQCKSCDER